MITDPKEWRISNSGFSIRTGWSTEKKVIAKYPGQVGEQLDPFEYMEWLENAAHICSLHNKACVSALGEE